jgi:hypothetical protein
MSNCVAQEIRWLLADESDGRQSATRRLAKARLAASMAEGLDRARIADLRAGLSDGVRAAFLDARLSVAERQIVVTALSHDPGARAEINSAAALLDCVGTGLIPLPPGLLAKAASAFAAANSARHGVAVGGQRGWQRQAPLILGVSLAASILVVSGLLSPGGNATLAPSAKPISLGRPAAQTTTKPSKGAGAGRAKSLPRSCKTRVTITPVRGGLSSTDQATSYSRQRRLFMRKKSAAAAVPCAI